MPYQSCVLPIKAWAEEDRPREKMLLRGKQHLSDAELLAILLGSGSREESALMLAQRILNQAGDLHELGKFSIKDLITRFKGVGEAKAVAVIAALELGRRRQLTVIKDRPMVRSSQDAYQALAHLVADLQHEEFWVLLLNRANRIIGREQISAGGMASTVVDPKIVFQRALEGKACGIIMCHNHPSGNLQPSQADIALTKSLRKAGEILDIHVMDHLIIAEKGYYSFVDQGMMD